jgi:hypothetical protein
VTIALRGTRRRKRCPLRMASTPLGQQSRSHVSLQLRAGALVLTGLGTLERHLQTQHGGGPLRDNCLARNAASEPTMANLLRDLMDESSDQVTSRANIVM